MTRISVSFLLGISVLLITVNSASAEPWTVIDAVEKAISSHPQSQIAEEVIAEARGERRGATALSPPVLTTRWDDAPVGEKFSHHRERRIGVSQDFEFPLRYVWLAKAANLMVDQALNERSSILLDLESEVRRAYLEAWAASEQVKILEEYNDTLKTYWSHVQIIAEQGDISQLDGRRTRVEVYKAENELKAAQRCLAAALEGLAQMTSREIDEIELVSPLESDPVDTNLISESILFESNPEVLAAKTEVGISGQEMTLATTAWLPELELTYFYRDDMYLNKQDFRAFQLQATVPIWFWWGGTGEIQATHAQLKRAKAELAACRLEISSEHSQLSQELKTAFEQYELYKSEVLPLAIDVFKTAQQNYNLGGSTYLDLIDARDELKDVQLDNIDIISDLYEKKISLDRLSGNSIALKNR